MKANGALTPADQCRELGINVGDTKLPCLRIRHDDGRVATDAEIWAELQRLEVQAFAGQAGQGHLVELVDELRSEIEAMRELLRLARAERDELAAKFYAEARAEKDAALWEERARHLGWRDEREPAR